MRRYLSIERTSALVVVGFGLPAGRRIPRHGISRDAESSTLPARMRAVLENGGVRPQAYVTGEAGNDDGWRMGTLEFCGEFLPLSDATPFRIGREGDLALDDNPYLHRNFLTLTKNGGFWWLDNVGTRIPATVSDPEGRLQAWLAPGAAIPLVFERTIVRFTAGPTTYELVVCIDEPQFAPSVSPLPTSGGATIGNVEFTPDQLLVIIALAEPSLLREGWGSSALPTSEQAAKRLGWQLTRFNRKLDNVCDKLTKLGVKGLHGGPTKLAGGRRARLVEYALAARWVTAEHLPLLDRHG